MREKERDTFVLFFYEFVYNDALNMIYYIKKSLTYIKNSLI